ncbi:MAG: Pr6Pr family membrane protein [Chitinophagaceae bacterium]
MGNQSGILRHTFLVAGASLGWFAVILQLILILANRRIPVIDTIISFFSYFTILTNILVAFCFSILLFSPASALQKWISRTRVLTAVTVYITIVGIVYNLILRNLWSPAGWQLVADELLHSVMPVLFMLYWVFFVPKRNLQWKDVTSWLIYPFVYLSYIIVRGSISGLYPYPFLDVKQLGYNKVFTNCGVLFLAFLLLSLLLVAVAKLAGKASQ